MRIFLIAISSILLSCTQESIDLSKQSKEEAVKEFKLINAQYDATFIGYFPQQMTLRGFHHKDDQLNDLSAAIVQRLVNASFTTKRSIEKRVNIDLLDSVSLSIINDMDKERELIDGLNNFWYHRYSVNPISGDHIEVLQFLENNHPMQSRKDFQNLLQRVKDCKRKFRSLLKRTQIQFDQGFFAPKILVENVILQLDSIINQNSTETKLYKKIQANLNAENAIGGVEKYLEDFVFFYERDLRGRLERWRNYLQETYLAKANENGSISEFKDGLNYYRFRLKTYPSIRNIEKIRFDITKKINIKDLNLLFQYDRMNPLNLFGEYSEAQKIRLKEMATVNDYQNFFSFLAYLDNKFHTGRISYSTLTEILVSKPNLSDIDINRLVLLITAEPGKLQQLSKL